MTLERILLQTIKFDLMVEHPYAYLLKFAKLIKGNLPETHACFTLYLCCTFIRNIFACQLILTCYTLCPKKGRHQTYGSNSANFQLISKIFTVSFSSKFAAKYLLHSICIFALPCETLMSENDRQSQTNAVLTINYKVQ